MLARFGMVLPALGFSLAAVAQQKENPPAPPLITDTVNAACVERLEIPTYPAIARQAQVVGTLSVTVTLRAGATVAEISVKPDLGNNEAQRLLFIPVQQAIRDSQFRKDCGGKQVSLVFEFRITGNPSDGQHQEVAFGFPNRFSITTRPIRYQPSQQQQLPR